MVPLPRSSFLPNAQLPGHSCDEHTSASASASASVPRRDLTSASPHGAKPSIRLAIEHSCGPENTPGGCSKWLLTDDLDNLAAADWRLRSDKVGPNTARTPEQYPLPLGASKPLKGSPSTQLWGEPRAIRAVYRRSPANDALMSTPQAVVISASRNDGGGFQLTMKRRTGSKSKLASLVLHLRVIAKVHLLWVLVQITGKHFVRAILHFSPMRFTGASMPSQEASAEGNERP